jgi:signal transduction histidine kinase
MLGSLAAIAVVVVGGFFALRSVTIDEAKRDTRELVQAEGRLVEEAGLNDGLLHMEPAAIARLDDLILGQIVQGSVARVKVKRRDGTIVYSDEPALIGKRFEIDEDEQELFKTGGVEVELSDLSEPEHLYERSAGELLEAYTPIRTPNGTPVLFEIYERFSSVNASAERLLRALAPPLLGGLLVLLIFQMPLAWQMARSLQRGHREREALLANAVEASSQERRRIASDLHDGVVQDLAGVAFGLAPIVAEADRRGSSAEAAALHGAIARLRQGVRDLRTLLVEIHPPSLESTGLEPALNDLLSPLAAEGIVTELHLDDSAAKGNGHDPLVYRVAREAVRNAHAHGRPEKVRIDVTHPERGVTRLVVTDDGRGFAPEERERRAGEGHVGLTLLESLVTQARGRLDIHSAPGEGTTVELEVPVA